MKKKPRRRKGPSNRESPEAMASRAVTVLWLLTLLTALLCEAGVFLTWCLIAWTDGGPGLSLFADLLWVASLVFGSVCLLLMLLVMKTREVMPPGPVIVLAAVVGTLPLLLAVGRLL